MKSYMDLHCSSTHFCKHAYLATLVAGGALSTHRFAWYPGNPRAHLFYVGKWSVLAILALHATSFDNVVSLREVFLPHVLLFSYRLPREVNETIVDFLTDCANCANRDLALLSELILAQRYNVAQWIIKARLRNHIRRFQSNFLNL